MMCSWRQTPPVDLRLLVTFFGSCFIVYALGRVIAWRLFRLEPVAASVFALGGIFSNNTMLGIPLAAILIGPTVLPAVALVLIFNSLILWTLVTLSVEWARHGRCSPAAVGTTLVNVLRNPLIMAILAGFAWGALRQPLPGVVDTSLTMVAGMSAPLSLIALGMLLSRYRLRSGWRESCVICLLKLLVQPRVILLLALALGLPAAETQVVVLLGSMAPGVNVSLMAQKFGVMQGAVAASTLFSTALSALSTPLLMLLVTHGYAPG